MKFILATILETLERSENKLQTDFYGVFKPNYKSHRFTGWTPPNAREGFGIFMDDLLSKAQQGFINSKELLNAFANVAADLEPSRDQVEDLVDTFIEDSVRAVSKCYLAISLVSTLNALVYLCLFPLLF